MKKLPILFLFIIILFFVPTVFGAFEEYDSKSFGGKAVVAGAGSVTTNATTNLSLYGWVDLHGYLGDDGGEVTTCWFEWGLNTSYYNSSLTYNYSRNLHANDAYGLTFPQELFLYNSSMDGNTSCKHFCEVGGFYDNISWIFWYNPVTLLWDWWEKATEGGLLNNITDYKDEPDGYYSFVMTTPGRMCFVYDTYGGSSCNIGDEFEFRIDNLLPDTTYHYRARAQNSINITNGTDMTFHTLSALYDSPNSSNVAETEADLTSHLYYDIGENVYCGFWVGNTSTSRTNFQFNYSSTDNPIINSGDFTYDIPVDDLTSGEYYYLRSWMNTTYGFWNSTNESYFLTLPNEPTGLTAKNASYSNIGLEWTNATVGDGTNRSTLIRYKSTGYPANPADGTEGYNGTSNNTLIEGLVPDTTYYFSAWHYINDSGSPSMGVFSGSFATISGETEGGLYNITVKYEDNQTLVSNTVMSEFNHTCIAKLRTGEILNITYPNTNPFSMNATQTPEVMFFDFKNRTLWRVITPEAGERNITFYVSDRPEYATGMNVSETQLWYTFSFQDLTTYFVGSNQSKLYIYKWNGTTKYYIHQDFWSAEDTVDASLQYGDRYYLGVWCPDLYIPFLQYFDAHETTDPSIIIAYEEGITETIYDYVVINFSWDGGGNGLWVNYTDDTFGTSSFTIWIYQTWKLNGTKILRDNATFALDQKDYQWRTVDGCNNSSIYYIEVEINHSQFTTNQTIIALLFPLEWPLQSPILDADWIEDWIERIVGDSPFVDTDPGSSTYDEFIPWTHIIAFGACLVLLMTIGHINMPLSMIGVGLLLIVIEVLLGLAVTRSVTFAAVGVLGGILLVILGIIVELGGDRK